uniref:Ig-like domain-containing protein n=1 Tax=Anopheles epiroticus TaxID=199890 RepID=A0A182PH82_9DIPT
MAPQSVLSGEKLYIKVADLMPKFTFLGPSLDDALKLQNEHDELLRQIQNMPTPLEEFYRKIQEKIASNERPNPTLIEEMAASLNAVWHDIKLMLAERRDIVVLNVSFFERLGEAYGKMSSLEVACNDTMIPIEIDAVREFLDSFRDLRGDMLAAVAATLKAGQQMLERLRVLSEIGTLDSRPNHIKLDAVQAIGQVESWLEDLSNRRNQLEQAWVSRKTQLEQCLTLAILAKQLDEIEQCLARVRSQTLSSFTLGESSEQASELLTTYQNLKSEAALLRDKTLKITKTTEELLASGCFAGDEACAKAYSVLNACSEHLEEIDHREFLLGQSRDFFTRAATVLKRLDQLEQEVAGLSMRPASPNDLPAHQKLLQELRETIGEVLQMGYSLVDDVGRTKPEVAGVQAMIERIEQRKLHFERYCNEESERNVRTAQALNEFLERYGQLLAWLAEAREERIVRGSAIHRMGENLPEAKDCLLLHHQFLNDLEIKGNAINNLLVRLTPSLEHLTDDQRTDVQRKIDLIHQQWIELKNCVNERVDLLKLYIRFHQEAETLRNQFDAHAIQFATFKDNPADHSLILAAIANIRQTLESLRPLGAQCLDQLQQTEDAYLQKTRAAQCVERTLAEFADRQSAVSNEWESWNSRRRTETTLKKIMAANMETLAVTSKLEEQLYPIFSTALDNPTDLIDFISRKRTQLQQDVRDAEADLTQRFDTIAQLELAGGGDAGTEQDIVAVKNNLNSIKTKLHSLGADFGELSDATEHFLRSIMQCRDSIREYFGTKHAVTGPGSVEAIAEEYEQFKQATMEYFRGLLQQSEQIIERVKALEPPGARELDTDKIITLLENLRTYFESQTESENCELKKQHSVLAFDRELGEVRTAIRAASEQLERDRGQYGESAAEAQTVRIAFEERATALQDLERRIDAFFNSGTELVRQYPETSPYIESETHKIRNEWTDLLRKLEDHRQLHSIAIEYFELITTIEKHYRTLNAELINANNKLTILNNVDVANDLVTQVDNTIRTHETRQLDALKKIADLSTQLYGSDKTITLYTENTKLFQTFYKIKSEVYERSKELADQQARREEQQRQEQLQREQEQQRLEQLQREQEEQQRLAQLQKEQEQEQQRLEQMQREQELEQERLAQLQREQEQELQRLEQLKMEQEEEQQRLEQLKREQEQEQQRLERLKQEQEREQQRLEQLKREQEQEQLRMDQLQREKELAQREATIVEDVKITTTTSHSGLPHQQQSFDVQTIDEEQYLQEPQVPLVIQTVEEQVHEQIHEVITTSTTLSTTQQPEASLRVIQPLADVCVQEGQRVRLQCVVAGVPDPMIEWYKNGISVQGNPDYRTSFDPASGVCTLMIDETVTADSADILCRAANEAGIADTTARLLVTEAPPPPPKPAGTPPTFAMRLLDGGVAQEGQPFQYDCVVSGQPTPTVHWYKGDQCIDGSPDYRQTYDPASGVASLRIEQVYLEDQTHYTCRAVNDCGSDETSAFLTVKPLEPTEFPDFPEPLSNVMARVGQKIRLEAKVSGTPQPELMWTHDGKHFTNREVKFFYENGRAQLVIDEAFLKDAGVYTLTAKNIAGEKCCSCNVVVKGRLPNETSDSELASDMEPVKPAVQLPLRDVSVFEGKPVRLDCVIVGQPEPEVIWYHGERPVKESNDFQLLFQGDRCSLVIREAFLEDAGEYRVVAINSAGEASSQCSVLVTPLNTAEPAVRQPVERVLPVVGAPPRFERLLADILADEGERVQFECAVSGDPRPTIRWYVNNREIPTDVTVSPRVHCVMRDDGVVKLIIERVLPDDKGVYTVKAANPSGEAKCFSNLIVKTINAPEFEAVSTPAFLTESLVCPTFRELFADRVVRQHEPTKFECIVIGKPQPKIRWFFNDQPVQGHDFLVSTSGDRQVLSIPEVRPELTGKITCYAENEAGNAQCVAIVQLLEQLGSTGPNLEVPLESALPTTESMQQIDTTGSSCVTLQKHVTTSSTSSFSSSSMATVQQNGVSHSHSEVHAESAKLDRSFHQVGDQAPQVAEAAEHKRYDQVNDQPATVQHEASSYVGVAPSHESIIANSGQISTGKPARRNMAPRFVTPFNGKIVDQGADVLIEGIVDGYPTPDVHVTKNDVELQPDGERIKVSYSLNKIVVELRNVSPLDAGRYTATASNAAGASTTTADLVVKKSIFPPVFGRRLQAQTVRNGDRVVLDVEVSGTPEPSVAWFKDNRPVQEALAPGSYALQQVGSCFKLIFEQVSLNETGKYMVVAKNAGGEAQSAADIAVLQCESAAQPAPQPAPQKHVSFVDMVQQQQLPRSEEALEGEGGGGGGGFSARQEYASEAKLHGPTTESTIVTETRRTTEATMRMEHKISFPDLPVRFSQRTQTPTVPTVTEGTSPITDPSAQQTAGTNTDRVATRSDATQTTATAVDQPATPTLVQQPSPTTTTTQIVRLPPAAQSESKRESSSISSSSSTTVVRDRPKIFEPLLHQQQQLVGEERPLNLPPPPTVAGPGMNSYPPEVAGSRVDFLKPQPEMIPTPPIGTLFQSEVNGSTAPKFPPPEPKPASQPEPGFVRARSSSPRPSADAIAMERLWSTPKAFGRSFGTKAAEEPVCQVYRTYRPPPTTTLSSSSSTFTKHTATTQVQQQQQAPQAPQQHNYSTLPFARKQTKPHQEHHTAKARSDSIRSDFQPIYQQPAPEPAPAPHMYSSFSSTQQFQASSTLSQQQYSQSAMQYQPFKPSLAVEAPVVRAPSPAPAVPAFVPSQAAPPPAQSFPPKITPFKPTVPTAAPAVFTPAPAQPPLNLGPVPAAPSCTLTPIPGAAPAFVSGPSYNQTPQPFKPLPPPTITPSSFGAPAASAPLPDAFAPQPQPQLQPQPQPQPYAAVPEPTGPVSLPPYQEPLSFSSKPTAAYGELKAPRMVQGVRLPVAAPLPPDFGYGAIAELGLEPGPQPTMGYAPKASSERKSSYYREQIEQSLLESMDKEPERVPAGGVKIIPPSPRKKSKPAGQSDTAGGVPASLEQPAESQQGQGASVKSPFTATESEYESDLDGTGARRQNGYLADTEEVVQKTASSVTFEQQQQTSIESFSSSSKIESHSSVVSEIVQQQQQQTEQTVEQKVEQQQQVVQEQQQQQQVTSEEQAQQPQEQQQQQQSEEVIISSSETVQKETVVEESNKTNFLVNNDLPEDLQPVKVLPTEEPLPTLKHVPVPAAVQPVTEPAPVPEPTPVEPQQQLQQQQQQPLPQQPEPIVPTPVQQNGYPTPSPAQPFLSDYESDAAAPPLAGYKPVHPVFAPPKQEFATGPAAPPPSSMPAQYYTAVTGQPISNTIATETSSTLQMKEMTESSNRVLNMQQTKRVVSLDQQQQQQQQSAAYLQRPSRFTPGEHRDSDGYDSDGNRIRPLWTPNPSDSDEPHYRSVRPNFQQPRSTSLPRQYERIQTPMEFDTLPVQMPTKIEVTAGLESSQHQRSSSLSRQSTEIQTTTTMTTETLKTQTLDRYASKRLATTPVPNTRDDMAVKAHRVAPINYIQKQADGMAQSFKTKAYHFNNEVMTDIKKTPIKPILKNAYGAPMPQQQLPPQQMVPPQQAAVPPQVYREESRVSQYDPTSQGFNRSTTSTPNVKQQQEEGVPTKTPLFVAPLKDIAVVSGQPARFECIVACDAAPSIRWTKDEAPIEEGYKYVPEYRNGVCRLSLPVAYEGDAGRYCCLAENHLGYAATCAELTVANSDWRANQ